MMKTFSILVNGLRKILIRIKTKEFLFKIILIF